MQQLRSGPEGLRFYGPLVLLPLVFLVLSLGLGRYSIAPGQVVQILFSRILDMETAWPATMDTVIFHVRLPRILAAMLIGGGLSVSGAAFQGVFRNPLVSPFILGVASGAGFGAALAILLFESALMVQLLSMLFGGVAVGMAFALSRLYRVSETLILVLAGVIVGTFFSSLLSLVKFVADPYDKLPVIVYWLMGSLATVSQLDLVSVTGPMLLGVLALFAIRWQINLLAMGDEEAKAMGVPTALVKGVIVVSATVVTASAVSISGIIGWVGLVIPHLARMVVGPDYRRLIPASLSFGACYLLLIDDLARTVTTSEIPLGILTATVGAPVFALILKRSSLGWSG